MSEEEKQNDKQPTNPKQSPPPLGGGLFRGSKDEVQGYDFSEFSSDAEHDRLQKDFKDFLVAKHISGKAQVPDGHVISSDRTQDTGQKVEIGTIDSLDNSKTAGITDKQEHAEQVIVRRDEEDNIESIELHCSCGKITKIEFVEDPNEESSSTLKAHKADAMEEFDEEQFRTMEFDGSVPESEADDMPDPDVMNTQEPDTESSDTQKKDVSE